MELLTNVFPPQNFTLAAVILGLPALGAFVNGVFGKRLGKDAVRLMALSAIGGAFLASILTFAMLLGLGPKDHGEHGAHAAEGITQFKFTAWHWFDVSLQGGFGTAPIEVAFTVDRLSSIMMLVITGVGFLIHLYASAYMWDDHRPDGGFHRFFAYLNLFCFAMLVLVMGSSLPILFVGWEGVGMCSYLLIGFWYSDDANAAAGKKAFIANRIGDFGLLVAMALLLSYGGSLDWDGIASGSGSLLQRVQVWPIGAAPTTGLGGAIVRAVPFLFHPFNPTVATVIGLALFLGCAGKSAQIPLYVWLPDAMAGPTPVSALIHAATMVTAGVYLVCRLWFVFLLSPAVMATIAVIGVATAFFAATIGLAQTDIKKVLAYSTVSQLGFMFLGVGVGNFSAGFFHVLTHAFFKACLFLGAGSVIHAMHAGIHDPVASQDMRNMGGLRKWLPTTYLTFLASCLAIAGFPLTSGFFSKDEILYRAYVTHISAAPEKGITRWEAPTWFGPLLYWVGILAATMTAFYMFRALFLTFWGDFKGWKVDEKAVAKHGHDDHGHHDDHHQGPLPPPHESPWQMTVPLMILGALALVAGFLNPGLFAHPPALEHWLHPLFGDAEHYVKVREGAPSEMLLAVPGVLACFVGAGSAYFVYVMQKGKPAKELTAKAPGLYRLVLDKWRVDELYENTVIGAVDSLADTAAQFDKWVVDGIIARLTAIVVAAFGTVLRAFQTGIVHVYAAAMVVGVAVFGWFFVWQPQAHATVREQSTGRFVVEAAPGLGYKFRWHSKTPDQPDSEAFSGKRSVEVDVAPGETKLVKVDVKNAFDRTTTGTVAVTRPSAAPAGSGAPVMKGSIQ
jgi:NADH-quinone oxidoreductase subunit L